MANVVADGDGVIEELEASVDDKKLPSPDSPKMLKDSEQPATASSSNRDTSMAYVPVSRDDGIMTS